MADLSPSEDHLGVEIAKSMWRMNTRSWRSRLAGGGYDDLLKQEVCYYSNKRSLSEPFVIARPTGARIRTRLRLAPADEQIVGRAAADLGRLAGQDLAWRCRLGLAANQRAERKRALTACSSTRWAGTITRMSDDQWQRAYQNLLDDRASLRRAIRALQARIVTPVGRRRGRVRGYASPRERYEKQRRLQHLQARLAKVEFRLAEGRVSVCRGGRRLAKLRHHVNEAELTVADWRARWLADRLFLTADGEASKPWGNQTIRVHPEEHWLELRLPTPLAHLSNTPGRAATYRLTCPVTFNHRASEWAAQVATGAVRYDLAFDPSKSRWYLDASWRIPAARPPSLKELRRGRALAVDLNADHLAIWVLDPRGNQVGPPHAIPLNLEGLPAACRNGRLRAAITSILAVAQQAGCRSIIVENLDFTDARRAGRETLGRGRRGKRFRRTIAGMSTRMFRDLLVGMATNKDLWVIAVDPAYTSAWGERYWRTPLRHCVKSSVAVTRHHAAAVVIGRRGLGFGARRRQGVPSSDQRIVTGELPARPGSRLWTERDSDCQEAGGQRRCPRKTRRTERIRFGNQVVQDRSEPPGQKMFLPFFQEWSPTVPGPAGASSCLRYPLHLREVRPG